MNKVFETAQDIFMEHAAQISTLFGLSDGMARMVAFLYMSTDPVSIPVICERLSLTKGTVSVYLRMLEDKKIITRAWSKRQGKQKFYEMNPRLWNDFLEDMKARAQKKIEITEDAIERSRQVLQKGEKSFKGEDRLAAKLLMERIERIREMNRVSRTLLDRFQFGNIGSANDSAPLQKIKFADK